MYFISMSGNRRMKSVEIVLGMGVGAKGARWKDESNEDILYATMEMSKCIPPPHTIIIY
jgi:hypothetical protein